MAEKLGKAAIYEAVTKAVEKVVINYKIAQNVSNELTKIFDTYLKPKTTGSFTKVNEADVTKKDANGNITHILCSISKKWLPATDEFFYKDSKGNGIAGYRRGSKPGEAVMKAYKRQSTGVINDMLAGRVSNEDGQKKLQELKAGKPDYSIVDENYYTNQKAKRAEASAKKAELKAEVKEANLAPKQAPAAQAVTKPAAAQPKKG